MTDPQALLDTDGEFVDDEHDVGETDGVMDDETDCDTLPDDDAVFEAEAHDDAVVLTDGDSDGEIDGVTLTLYDDVNDAEPLVDALPNTLTDTVCEPLTDDDEHADADTLPLEL